MTPGLLLHATYDQLADLVSYHLVQTYSDLGPFGSPSIQRERPFVRTGRCFLTRPKFENTWAGEGDIYRRASVPPIIPFRALVCAKLGPPPNLLLRPC